MGPLLGQCRLRQGSGPRRHVRNGGASPLHGSPGWPGVPLAGGQSPRAGCLGWTQNRGMVPGAGLELAQNTLGREENTAGTAPASWCLVVPQQGFSLLIMRSKGEAHQAPENDGQKPLYVSGQLPCTKGEKVAEPLQGSLQGSPD